MSDALQRIVASYETARRWMEQMRAGIGRQGTGRAALAFDSVEQLALAVAQGRVGFGDLVSGNGWLSLYATWYLPPAYSPYHLSVSMAALGPRWMVKTDPVPALLPAGQLPFAFKEQIVGFLYPAQTPGFTAQLLPDDGGSRYGARVQRASADDNPWIFSLDNGSGTGNPMDWAFTLGDQALERMLGGEISEPNEGGEFAGINQLSAMSSGTETPVFGDPALVRRAVRVPSGSQPIPILFPPKCRRHLHSAVRFQARIAPLDAEVLAELSRLGQPLTEKAFALFCGEAHTSPFCLRVEGDECQLNPAPIPADHEAPSQGRVGTLLVEWYFEDPQTGNPVPFDDDALLSWFIPCAKNHLLAIGGYVLPTRWTGKVYGFEGPLYFFQTGPVGFTMSPEGFFTATQIVGFDASFAEEWKLWKGVVTKLQRDLVERFRILHGRTITIRTTYLTNWDWIGQLGNVLEGRAIWKAAQENLREEHRVAVFLNALQSAREEKETMRPIKVLFVSSNPVGTKHLQLETEVREVKERIKLAKHRDLLQVEQVNAARPRDLQLAFNEHEVDIFHFSGHGAKSGELGLCAEDGTFHPLQPEALAALMRVLGQKVQVAVINACYSQAQAEAIRQHVPCAIGMNAAVGDKAAIVFAAAFYGALAFGHDVQNAYDQGILALQLENIAQDHIPQLLVKDGVDASQVRPVPAPTQEANETSSNPS